MPTNTGLKFDPQRGINNKLKKPEGYIDPDNFSFKQSLPTLASDYYSPIPGNILPVQPFSSPFPVQKGGLVPIIEKLKENPLYGNTFKPIQAMDEEERAAFGKKLKKGLDFAEQQDPLYDYNKWNKDIDNNSDEGFKEWKERNKEALFDKSHDFIERAWKNKQFVDNIGMDIFNQIPDANMRDELYKDYLTEGAIRKKYKDNRNLETLLALTPESRVKLIESGYKPEKQVERENKELNNRNWWDYSAKERLNAGVKRGVDLGLFGTGLGFQLGALFSGASMGTSMGLGAFFGGTIGTGYGLLSGAINPNLAKDNLKASNIFENEEILDKVMVADGEKMKDKAADLINEYKDYYITQYNNGQISEAEINKKFDDIALNGKRRPKEPDELGNQEEYDYVGSNYYSAFKDSKEFANFGVMDKLNYIAQTEALAQKFGEGNAIRILDNDMQRYISDKQTWKDWAVNTGWNVLKGGVVNLANNVVGVEAAFIGAVYGQEALANYLKGKDISGNGEDNALWRNPMFLNKADQYNTLSAEEIAKADANGGVSPYNNVYKPEDEGQFWSWQTLNEALKMNKFFWSDGIKNAALSKVVTGLVKAAGGVETAIPGVLATESSQKSQIINRVGQLGVLGSSSLGIDVAYGMQTYEEVLNENNSKIDKLIDQQVEEEFARRLASNQAVLDFRKAVDAENAYRKERAGERGNWIPVNEKEAWNAFVNYSKKNIREEIEKQHTDDRQEAENKAAMSYAIDASIEAIRMAPINATFRSWLFDRGTINAIKANNPYMNNITVGADNLYKMQKWATTRNAVRKGLRDVFGGFQTNYFDDVTVGFAKAYGIQDYNNYLYQKYNPAAYGAVVDEYANPLIAGALGATASMTEGRSLLDGAIGAIGSAFTIMPNTSGMLNHSQRMKKLEESIKDNSEKGTPLTKINWFDRYAADIVSNPIIQAIANAREETRLSQQAINIANEEIKKNGFAFDNMVPTISALNQKEMARDGVSMLQAKDAKDREAFELAMNLLDLKTNGAVANAQADPMKEEWSKKKKFAHTIATEVTRLLGIPLFEQAESSFTRAMRTLEDASTIDELPTGLEPITMEEGEENEAKEKAMRQQELIKTFLAIPENKQFTSEMSQEEKEEFAKERLKKNASGLLDIIEKAEAVKKKLDKSVLSKAFTESSIRQVMFDYILDDRWKKRIAEGEESISGEKIGDDFEGWLESKKEIDPAIAAASKYGSKKGHERAVRMQEETVKELEEMYKQAQQMAKEDTPPGMSLLRAMEEKARRYAVEERLKEDLEKAKNKLQDIKNDGRFFVTTDAEGKEVEAKPQVIKARDILKLHPDERLRMLDDYYRDDYSKEQQEEIDKAKSLLIEDGTPLGEALERVRDSAIMLHRIEDNMRTAKKIMQDPGRTLMMERSLQRNRKEQVVKYFNDKVIREVFNSFINDPALIEPEKVNEKARSLSSTVLRALQKKVDAELKDKDSDYTDADLTRIQNGIQTVLSERSEKMKSLLGLDAFLKRTRKISHTEVTPSQTIIDPETKEEKTLPEEQKTEEVELSDNDRKLLEYALEFAADREIELENLPEAVTTEAFDKYIEERNHAYQIMPDPNTGKPVETNIGVVENRVVPVGKDYMKSLVSDAIADYEKNKKEVEEAKKEKEVKGDPKSVAEKPVNPEGKASKDEKKEGQGKPEEKGPENVEKLDTSEKNKEVLRSITSENSNIANAIHNLLDEIDGLKNTEDKDGKTRDHIKDIIKKLLKEKQFNDIKQLQRDLFRTLLMEDASEYPGINTIANAIASMDIKNTRVSQADIDAANDILGDVLEPRGSVLTCQDLDKMANTSNGWETFITERGIVPFLQAIQKIWNKKRSIPELHNLQVRFVYDPELARMVKESMGEENYNPNIDAPLLMVVPVKKDGVLWKLIPKNKLPQKDKSSKKDKSQEEEQKPQLYYIGNRYYQVIGILPSSHQSKHGSEAVKQTSNKMSALREKINYDIKNKEGEVVQLLHYSKSRTGKSEGGVIQASNIQITGYTEEGARPEGTAETPLKDVTELMDENVRSETERFVKPDGLEEYDKAKQEGNLQKLRGTTLYKAMKKYFIDCIFKQAYTTRKGEDFKGLFFRVAKGTKDGWGKLIRTKAIGNTMSRIDPSKKIVDVLRAVLKGEDVGNFIDHNSRFKRLHDKLKDIKLNVRGVSKDSGEIIDEKSYNKSISEYEESVKKAIENNFDIDGLAVKITKDKDNNYFINVYSKDPTALNPNSEGAFLAQASVDKEGQLTELGYARFVANIILDQNGEVRKKTDNPEVERVRWEVNYTNADTMRNKDLDEKTREAARTDLESLYEDGIFEMRLTKLAYPIKEVSAQITNNMRQALWPEQVPAPEKKPSPTGEKPGTVDTKSGNVDPDSGIVYTKRENEIIQSNNRVYNAVMRLIRRSKDRNLVDDKHYDIGGRLHARVTSIKSAIGKALERFNPNSGWKTPSTLLGNSLDAFGRDVFNRLYDDAKSDAERIEKIEKEGYPNSTAQNYHEVYTGFQQFKARLLAKPVPEVILSMRDPLNPDDPGKLTVAGNLKVKVKNGDKILEKVIAVAGTIDAISIDEKGRLHLYDFKTHRGDSFTADDAIEKGYDRQLSMYADFLERELKEFGIKVASINIIPVKCWYPTPEGINNNGKPIPNPQKVYREGRGVQLEMKNIGEDDSKFMPLTNAYYKVEEEFPLTRLTGEALTASYENMTAEERALITEAIEDQGKAPLQKGGTQEGEASVQQPATQNPEVKAGSKESSEEAAAEVKEGAPAEAQPAAETAQQNAEVKEEAAGKGETVVGAQTVTEEGQPMETKEERDDANIKSDAGSSSAVNARTARLADILKRVKGKMPSKSNKAPIDDSNAGTLDAVTGGEKGPNAEARKQEDRCS